MSIEWGSIPKGPNGEPPPNALASFFVAEVCFTYCDNGRLYRHENSAWSNAVVTYGKIRTQDRDVVDRVVFHDNLPGSLLLGFDVIDDDFKTTQIDYQPNSLVFNSLIRCFLQSSEKSNGPSQDLGEAVYIRVRFGFDDAENPESGKTHKRGKSHKLGIALAKDSNQLARVKNFWLSHSRVFEQENDGSRSSAVNLLNQPGQDLKTVLANLSKAQPLTLGETRDGRKYTGVNTAWSTVLRGLLHKDWELSGEWNKFLNLRPEFANFDDDLTGYLRDKPPVLTVSFVDTGAGNGPFVIQFEARAQAPSKNSGIKCLGIWLKGDDAGKAPDKRKGPSKEILFDVAAGQEWVFRQRGSFDSCVLGSQSDLAKVCPAPWVLELSCVSASSVASQVERWLDGVRPGVKAYSSATASFLPQIKTADDGPVFTALYKVVDRTKKRDGLKAIFSDPWARPSAPKDQGVVTIEPWSIQFTRETPTGEPQPQQLTIEFPLCKTTKGEALTSSITLSPAPLKRKESYRGFAFYSTSHLLSDKCQRVRMGSLELEFPDKSSPRPQTGTAPACELRIEDLGVGAQIEIDLSMIVAQVYPGGQDDIPEDSYIGANTVVEALPCRAVVDEARGLSVTPEDLDVEQAFYRPRPLLINLRGQSSACDANTNAGLLLIVDEKSAPGVNRTLRLYLDHENGAADSKTVGVNQKVVVLDSDPFLVAQLSFPPLGSQATKLASHVAAWSNADGDGAKWQIPVAESDFTLTLPAQGVGEEMIKNKDYQLPLDFRLAPPTKIGIQTSYQQTHYAEVPWNLRRLLGYAGQRAPGVAVTQLNYELIYGLSCQVDQPFVRLAEVFALLGAIPGRLPKELAAADFRDPGNSKMDGLRRFYDQWRKEWAHIYRRYQSRLAILEPWDADVMDSLTLKHGMSCIIRYSSQNGSPIPSFPANSAGKVERVGPADMDDPITPARRADRFLGVPWSEMLYFPAKALQPLRGGVTWGFESRNIFNAVTTNLLSTPDSASVSDLDLTALGGFGHQQASFDLGKTSIFADANMGRTYYYKLERLGRICVFWNKAKHVIVYERSVVPSRQFFQEQNLEGSKAQETYGIPILRKVEEYIEILEEERKYPDDHLVTKDSTTPQNRFVAGQTITPAQGCGCIAGCVFPKGTKIYVSSSWGSDVNSKKQPLGWKVPLWRRGATPPDVYPLPKISLSIMSQFGGSTVESPCDIANPENLYFYTDTSGLGSDSDQWPAIIGLDTIDIPVTSPAPDKDTAKTLFNTKNPTVPAAADSPVPLGCSPCTFSLFPPQRPANIVANRGPNPIAAVLQTVTMMRGCAVPSSLGANADELKGLGLTYQDAWTKLLQSATPEILSDKTKFLKFALGSDIKPSLDGITKAIADQAAQVRETWGEKTVQAVNLYNQNSTVSLRNQVLLGIGGSSGLKQIRADVDAEIANVKSSAADQKQALRQLVEEQFSAFQQTILQASATPGIMTSVLLQYYNAAMSIRNQSAQSLQKIANQDAASLAEMQRSVLDLRAELMQTWASANSAKLLPELGDLSAVLRVFSREKQDLLDSLKSAGDNLPPGQEITTLKSRLTAAKSKFTGQSLYELNKIQTGLKSGFASKEASITNDPILFTSLDVFRREVTQVVQNGQNWASLVHKGLNDLADKGVADDVSAALHWVFSDPAAPPPQAAGINDFVKSVTAPAYQQLQALIGNFGDELNALSGVVDGGLKTNLEAVVGLASGKLQNIAEGLKAELDGVAGDVTQAVLNFRDSQLAELNDYIGKNLDVMRQAGGQVRDLLSNTNSLLSLARCYGDAPVVDSLSFLPGKIGYYFQDALGNAVNLTPVTTTLQQAGNVLAGQATDAVNNALDSMKLQVPAWSLGDHLTPPDLKNFQLKDIFPKFAGLDLSSLLNGVDLNEDGGKIKIQHGIDPQTRSAWVQANVGAHIEDVPIFEAGSICVRLMKADFSGVVRLDTSQSQGVTHSANGTIIGDWSLIILGQEIVALTKTNLILDNGGKFRFLVDPQNVRLPSVLQFVTDYLSKFLDGLSGLSIRIKGMTVEALMNLPIPDIQGLTTGFSNLRMACQFGIGFAPPPSDPKGSSKFRLQVCFGLSAPDRPFNVAMFLLGGAGFINASTSYFPEVGPESLTCTINFGVMASASLAISLGPISGGVYVFAGITAKLDVSPGKPASSGASLGAVLLIRGQANLAGIVSAYVSMGLTLNDENGTLIGRGHYSISVSICWCFTLNIDMEVEYPIGSSGRKTSSIGGRSRNGEMAALLDPDIGDDSDGRGLGGPYYADFFDPLVGTGVNKGEVELKQLIIDYVVLTEAA